MRRLSLAVLALILAVPAQAFDVEGYRDGMTVMEVTAVAQREGLMIAQTQNTDLLPRGITVYWSDRRTFTFCEGRLTGVGTGHVDATVSRFIEFVAGLEEEFRATGALNVINDNGFQLLEVRIPAGAEYRVVSLRPQSLYAPPGLDVGVHLRETSCGAF